MLLIVSKLYTRKTEENVPETLIITNFPFVARHRQNTLEDDVLNSKKNTEYFVSIIEKACFKNKILITEKPFKDLTSSDQTEESAAYDDTKTLRKLFISSLTPALDNICFMDMRAEEKLKPTEAQKFKFVVFGGILGDHPPQDRAKDFRERFTHIRQLGTV